jgi:hypothetical protein
MRVLKRRLTWIPLYGAIAAASACNAVLGIGEPNYVAVDGGTADGSATDGATDPNDSGSDGADGSSPEYHDMTDVSFWKAVDLGPHGDSGYLGGAFDGRYVYFAPKSSADIARYDTQGTFAFSDWTFEVLDGNAAFGAAFDGHHVFFGGDDSVTRIDPQTQFGMDAGLTIDTATLQTGTRGFVGAVPAGDFVYFVPAQLRAVSGPTTAFVGRYDTKAAFGAKTSWKFFDHATVNANAVDFFGGVFDGKYVYFAPKLWSGHTYVARYDTTGTFDQSSSWQTSDAVLVDPAAQGFEGAAYDGKRYVYFIPCADAAPRDPHGVVLRYDKTLPFGETSAWKAVDLVKRDPLAQCYRGAAFDGRYLYLVPFLALTSEQVSFVPPIVRLDTEKDFEDPLAWTSFDLKKVSPNLHSYAGAVFDGRYVYLVPWDGSIALRFEARSTPSMPARYRGSFL